MCQRDMSGPGYVTSLSTSSALVACYANSTYIYKFHCAHDRENSDLMRPLSTKYINRASRTQSKRTLRNTSQRSFTTRPGTTVSVITTHVTSPYAAFLKDFPAVRQS